MAEAVQSAVKRCAAVRRNGQQCASRALPGSAYCFSHDPERAEERRAARQRGGRHSSTLHRARRRLPEPLAVTLERLERAMAGVEQGTMSPAQAQAIAALARAVASVWEVGELQLRLERVEEVLQVQGGVR